MPISLSYEICFVLAYFLILKAYMWFCVVEVVCVTDSDCPSQTACINSQCVNPCDSTQPCGVNTRCQVFDTPVWRTMVCECLPGYQGNAAVRCDLSKFLSL